MHPEVCRDIVKGCLVLTGANEGAVFLSVKRRFPELRSRPAEVRSVGSDFVSCLFSVRPVSV